MEKYSDSELRHTGKTGGNRGSKEVLAYKYELKPELAESRGVLAEAKSALEEIMDEVVSGKNKEKESLVRETSNLKIIYLGKKLNTNRFYFGVNNKNTGLDYFVKVSVQNGILVTGPEELIITEQVKKDLEGMKGVRVIKGVFGFHERGKTYFVSRFEGALVGSQKEKFDRIKESDHEKYEELVKRYETLVSFLKSITAHALDRKYGDIDKNIGYDEKTDEFVVYDLAMYDGETDNGLFKAR